ncbi:MAG: hypothetical protein HQ581_19865 [Planctomycetes bacterium]|nr:hypothetical protein [Planctomycetota bacterium]
MRDVKDAAEREKLAQAERAEQFTVEGDEAIDELAGGIKKMLADLSGVIGHVTESAEQLDAGHQAYRIIFHLLPPEEQKKKSPPAE